MPSSFLGASPSSSASSPLSYLIPARPPPPPPFLMGQGYGVANGVVGGAQTTSGIADAASAAAVAPARRPASRHATGPGHPPLPRPPPRQCPRCGSANTKFCYYNNYSLSQPRHFCKACKRYWTRGGTLRNVPVGGGCRKNKRSRSGAGVGGAAGRSASSAAAAAAAVTSSSAASALSLPPPSSTMQSLTSALGLTGGTSLASLLLGGGGGGAGGDHLGLFQAAYEMQQQQQTQVDHLLGLGYGTGSGGGAGAQIHLKPWMQQQETGAGGAGIMDSFYAPLLSGSLVPGLEELHVKAEAAGAGEHHQQKAAAGDQNSSSWELPTPSSSNIDANIIASDALMAAAASMNPAVSSTSTAPATAQSSFMYWANGGIGGAAAAWPDLANCGSSIATLF